MADTQTDPHARDAGELADGDLSPTDLLDELEEVGHANGSRVVVVIARKLRNILTDGDEDVMPQRPIGAEAQPELEPLSPAAQEYMTLHTRLVAIRALGAAPEPTGPGDAYHERMRMQSGLDEIRRVTDQLADLLPDGG